MEVTERDRREEQLRREEEERQRRGAEEPRPTTRASADASGAWGARTGRAGDRSSKVGKVARSGFMVLAGIEDQILPALQAAGLLPVRRRA